MCFINMKETLFDSHFLKLFFRIVIINIKNIILLISENFSCTLNLGFVVFLCCFEKEKEKTKNQTFFLFLVFFIF